MKSSESKAVELVKKYATNRAELKEVKESIEALLYLHDYEIDLKDHWEAREVYLESDSEHWKQGWLGWEVAVEKSGLDIKDGELELAILLDKKKAIGREAGNIKRAIYNNGSALIRGQ